MGPNLKTGLALALDMAAGEPPEAVHPVRWMGRLVELSERAADALGTSAAARRLAGVAVALGLPAGVYFSARGMLRAIPEKWRGPAEAMMFYTALATRSLGDTAREVDEGLGRSLDEGRGRVSSLVGRDTDGLDEAGVVRAAVESVAENANDGVVAPMIYGSIGGAPLALAYKMVNTLDSMIGYRNEQYRDFGWAAARLDDLAGYVPARVTALAAVAASPLLGADGFGALSTWLRDARGHQSPNAGVCESAFAGALNIGLGGANTYEGVPAEPHTMGNGSQPPQRQDIGRAVSLMQGAALTAFAGGAAVRWVMGRALRKRGRCTGSRNLRPLTNAGRRR